MSPVFDRRVLRRWFHMPAFAVIAVSVTLVILGDRAADTWMAWKRPPAPAHTVELVGRARIPGIAPDRAAWQLSVAASGTSEAEAAQHIGERTRQVVDQLIAAGLEFRELDISNPSIEERAIEYPLDGKPRRQITHDASQILEISAYLKTLAFPAPDDPEGGEER